MDKPPDSAGWGGRWEEVEASGLGLPGEPSSDGYDGSVGGWGPGRKPGVSSIVSCCLCKEQLQLSLILERVLSNWCQLRKIGSLYEAAAELKVVKD